MTVSAAADRYERDERLHAAQPKWCASLPRQELQEYVLRGAVRVARERPGRREHDVVRPRRTGRVEDPGLRRATRPRVREVVDVARVQVRVPQRRLAPAG